MTYKIGVEALAKTNRVLQEPPYIDILSSGKKLPAKYEDHALSEKWKGHRECYIEPDWLLIYYITKNILTLTLHKKANLLIAADCTAFAYSSAYEVQVKFRSVYTV